MVKNAGPSRKNVTKKKKKPNPLDPHPIQRFSKLESARTVPISKYFNPKPDPVLDQENRKMKQQENEPKKPHLEMFKYGKGKDKFKLIPKFDQEPDRTPGKKYVIPKTEEEIEASAQRRAEIEALANEYICPKELTRLPSTKDVLVGVTKKRPLKYGSTTAKGPHDKQMAKKLSYSESTFKAPIMTERRLSNKVPGTQIIINKDKSKRKGRDSSGTGRDSSGRSSDDKKKKFPNVNSFDYIYSPPYRVRHKAYKMYRGPDEIGYRAPPLSPNVIVEEVPDEIVDDEMMEDEQGEGEGEDLKHYRTMTLDKEALGKETVTVSVSESDVSMYGEGEGGEGSIPVKHAISKASVATSIASVYKMQYPTDDQYDRGSLVPGVINKILQKYARGSETEFLKQDQQPYKHGTLKSHSTTAVPAVPKSFFFGVREGSMHYGDETFSDKSRFRAGLPMCVVAYIMSFIKQPAKWKTKDVDFVLEMGDKLFLKSLELNHLHDNPRILQPEELCDVVELVDKKIKYKIYEPDIAGFTKSSDPKVYNLLKGLKLFFQRHRAGILQTYNTNILIFKQKFYYVFDPEPRNSELFSRDDGKAIIASFYDLPSVMTMLITRGKLDNWPFIISKIAIRKLVTVGDKDDVVSLSSEFREESLYRIVNPFKAVVGGNIQIDDHCFGDSKSKQAFAVATVALVYSHITPACAWHRKTIDKILLVANQFYLECVKDNESKELNINNIPAFFTIGPLMIEICIYSNQFAGLMYRKGFCLFEELLTKFFCQNNSAIVEVDRYVLSVWKHREVFYTLDPYSRDKDGFKIKEGVACVIMCTNLENVVTTILHNFPDKDFIFKIHALKVIRVNRDPEFGKFPRSLINSETSIIETIKVPDKTKFAPKNVTVDKTEQAAKSTMLEEPLDPSILEIGSFVGSLDQKYVTKIPICFKKPQLLAIEEGPEKVYDLDSPSLSETQIERDRPSPLKTDSFEFKLLDEILKEELEICKLMDMGEGEEEEGEDEDYWKLMEQIEMEGRGIDMEDEMIQKGKDLSLISKKGKITNTYLQGLEPVEREVLEPNKPPRRRRLRRNRIPKPYKKVTEEVVEVTQKDELAKTHNFIDMPDGSQVLYGTKNITVYGKTYDDASPFVSAIAIVMAKKYTMSTWTQHVVDSTVRYGFSLFNNIDIRYTDAPKIVIPKLEIGSNAFNITIQYIFDSLLAQNILEQALEKVVFKEQESCIIVTQRYSAAVFKKRFLYYMFDPYGSNLVGLGEGPENKGVACVFRFVDLYSLVSRFLYNKKQREMAEPVEATRFIISTVAVTVLTHTTPKPLAPRQANKIEGGYQKPPKDFASDPSKPRPPPDGAAPPPDGAAPPPEAPPPAPGAPGKPGEEGPPAEVDLRAPIVKNNKLGYERKKHHFVIEGTGVLPDRQEGIERSTRIKECHFICICVIIGVIGKPIEEWDTRRVNKVFNMGLTLYDYVDHFGFSGKRNISNLLFDQFFFNIVVVHIPIPDEEIGKRFETSLGYLMKKHKFLMMQFPNVCYVLYQGEADTLHLFDCYGVPDPIEKAIAKQQEKEREREKKRQERREQQELVHPEKVKEREPPPIPKIKEPAKACWIGFVDKDHLMKYLNEMHPDNINNFFFYTVKIINYRKASKKDQLEYKLRVTKIKQTKRYKEHPLFTESEEWLKEYPIPWSRMTPELASGFLRGPKEYKWHRWDIEYPGDLYSMTATTHQCSLDFPKFSRNKQTIANCIVAIIMTEVYDFTEWNQDVIDTILEDGDKYFNENFEDIKEKNYEIEMDDFDLNVDVFPYNVNIEIKPVVEGTMFVMRQRQYNLSKALKYFFEGIENRCGIIFCDNGQTKTKYLAFGRIRENEFFMFDCQTIGPPMFIDRDKSRAYILRCISMNRLLNCMTVILRGGDFFIYEVIISEEQTEQVVRVHDLTKDPERKISEDD